MNVFLKPGECYASERPATVSMVLGSCVAVIMFNARMKVGAICHAVLPVCHSNDGNDCRYVDSSILCMIRKLERMGIRREEIEVKLLGGADVIECTDGNGISVGRQNIETALKTIEKENLRLEASDIGGKQGRKIHFNTSNGKVIFKRIASIGEGLFSQEDKTTRTAGR
jgi:chemotaxis protein CheD